MANNKGLQAVIIIVSKGCLYVGVLSMSMSALVALITELKLIISILLFGSNVGLRGI